MIILCLLIILIILTLTRLILHIIVWKYGKFSYDGFKAAGFAYNAEKDIFYSSINAWQKNFGYTYAYDVFAPIFRMIIDTEPIRFSYNNKNWLITFWKGQYGIVTGAEVGIYCTTEQKVNKKTIYFSVNDLEMPHIYLILSKNGEVVTKVNAKHWWLAVFKLGMFSNPKELAMDINIAFPTREMLEAFLSSFQKLRYTSKDYRIIDNTFCFKYKKPHTRKVWTRNWLTDSITQFLNRRNVKLYNKYLRNLIENNRIDDSSNPNNLIILNDLLPDLIKNDQKETNSNKIIKRLFSKDNQNIVLLNSDAYYGNRGNKYE